jgi:DNA topoisomerase-1
MPPATNRKTARTKPAARRTSRATRPVGPFTEPVEAARAAALRHVSDDRPGIRRRKSGRGFSYLRPEGETVRDLATLKRIRALAIPPAWTDVWICPSPDGHLQATGRDARGRKQYRYHARWREVRDETKYAKMVLFGTTLPRIRARVEQDLGLPGLPQDKLLAIIVRLLETTFIRVGNEEYARNNRSFGLTTLLGRHVTVLGDNIRFRFQGKSGKAHEVHLNDRRLARLVTRIRDLPGQDLFQYVDEAGEPQPINSADVNEYLRLIADQDFTAKDFRTWAGSLLAARSLDESSSPESKAAAKSAVVAAAESVAHRLGNTAAICRKCYIHPSVLEAFQDPALFGFWVQAREGGAAEPGLSEEESALLRFLQACSPPLSGP